MMYAGPKPPFRNSGLTRACLAIAAMFSRVIVGQWLHALPREFNFQRRYSLIYGHDYE